MFDFAITQIQSESKQDFIKTFIFNHKKLSFGHLLLTLKRFLKTWS